MIIEVDGSFYEKIEKLEARCFKEPWNAEVISSLHSAFGHIACDVGDDGEVLGYIFYNIVFESAEILRLCVDDEFRRRGIGGRLIDFCKKNAALAGCTQIFLDVRSRNKPAIALYEKAGFVKISERRQYYPDGDTALEYVWRSL